jgi:hypothetical protein
MLLKYWNKVAGYLQERPYAKIRVVPVPTTILRKGEPFSLQAKGQTYRALGPLGVLDVGSLESAVEKWGEIALQQLVPQPEGVFEVTLKTVRHYADYFKVCVQSQDQAEVSSLMLAVQYIVREVGDPVYACFAKYRGVYFLYEVGPVFMYDSPLASLRMYATLHEKGEVSLADLRLKFQRYWEWLDWDAAPEALTRIFYDDLLFRTGNGTFVGQIDGTCKEGVPECNRLEPCARLYRIAGFKDLPDPDVCPRANRIAFVCTASLVHSAALRSTVLSLVDLVTAWDHPFQEITLYLEGVPDAALFAGLAKGIQSPWPIGVVLSTYGQVFSYAISGLDQYASSVILDADALVDEGWSGRVRPPDTEVSLPFCVGEWMAKIKRCGVMYTRRFTTPSVWALAQYGDFAYVNGQNWNQTVIMRATICQ